MTNYLIRLDWCDVAASEIVLSKSLGRMDSVAFGQRRKRGLGVEVKTTLEDLRDDLRRQKMLAYAEDAMLSHVALAVSEKIAIDQEELAKRGLPETWGIYRISEKGTVGVERQAKRLRTLPDTTPGQLLIAKSLCYRNLREHLPINGRGKRK